MALYGPALQVNDVVQIVTWCQLGDQAGLNVNHYRITAAPAPAAGDLGLFIGAWQTNGCETKLKACVCSTANYLGLLTRVIHPTLSLVYQDTTNAAAGGVAGEPLPRQVAGFIRKYSINPGKRTSGRIYVPFPSEASNTTGIGPTAGYLSDLASLAAVMISTVTTGTGTSGTWSIWNRGAGVAASVRTYLCLPKWATQRKRSSFNKVNVPPF